MKEKTQQLEIVSVKEEPTIIAQKGGLPLSVRELKRLLKRWLNK